MEPAERAWVGQCGRCGEPVWVGATETALLDEEGFAHAVCPNCGAENAYRIDAPVEQPRMGLRRWLRQGPIVRVALLIVILGLVLLLIPAYVRLFTQPSEPPPDPYRSVRMERSQAGLFARLSNWPQNQV
ncbi:MAG: hypothetical protein IH851_10425 [Armatimonadetes bacterium]|nr:hypothetical protein [Armatimonadota bacterium]